MNVFSVFATLGFNTTEFEAGLGAAEQRLRGVEQQFSSAGRSLTTHVSAPLIAIGVGALKAGGDFQAAMNQVAAVSSATGEELEALRAQARELGATTQFSASEAADAMNFLAMAGMKTDDILGAMPDTLQLAAAAQLDMGSAADIVTNIMAGFGMEIDELTHATDVLVQAFTNANTDLPQLAEAMKYAGPVANVAGVDFEEAAAAISLMGNAGIQGSMAGTALRGALTEMLNPTSKTRDLMEATGISFRDAKGNLLPLIDIVRQFEGVADGGGVAIQMFGDRAGPAFAAVINQGSDALNGLTTALHESGGRAKEVADVQMEGLNGAMKLLKSAAESLLISIAESGLLDAAASFLNLMAGWIQNLSELNPWVLRIATVLGGLLAALGPVIWAVGSFAGAAANLLPLLKLIPGMLTAIRTAFTLLTGPVGIIIGVITALVAVFATDFLGIRTFVVNVWNAAVEAFKRAGAVIRDVLIRIQDSISSFISSVRDFFTGGWRDALSNAVTGIRDWWARVTDFLRGLPREMLGFGKDIITGLIDGVKSMVTNAVDAVKGVGNSVITGFKNLLGIESPSKVFHGFGLDITEGLARGVEAGTPRAVAAVETLGRALKGAGDAIAKGAWDPQDRVKHAIGDASTRAEAVERIVDQLDVLRAQERYANNRTGVGGNTYRKAVLPLIHSEQKALEEELRKLRAEYTRERQEAVAASRATSQSAGRFSLAVDEFVNTVRGYTLANQRY